MQSAQVKKTLSPVHRALYDHISSFDWCVRGDVRREDFDAVFNDKKPGEKIISGDYTSATDLIYLEAVEAIVDVLAECPELGEEERRVLEGSFKDLRWESRSGKQWPIKRGSMMGNLISFPLLCLLNKACFDIASDIYRGSGQMRVSRINGDDCLFAGDRGFYDQWKLVTSTFGFVVNEEKTGLSDCWADLNSQPCLLTRCGLNPKPVISFLRPFRSEPDGLVDEVYQGIRTLSAPVRAWVWNVAMRHEISMRKICVSNLPSRTVDYLLTKKWFRHAVEVGPAPVNTWGVERKIDAVVANPPLPVAYNFVTSAADRLQREHTEEWLGVKLHNGDAVERNVSGGPAQSEVVKSAYWRRHRLPPPPESPWYKRKGEPRWQFVWPKPLYEWFERSFPHLILCDEACQSEWIDDHPFLTTKSGLVNLRPRLKYQFRFAPCLWNSIPVLTIDGVIEYVQ